MAGQWWGMPLPVFFGGVVPVLSAALTGVSTNFAKYFCNCLTVDGILLV